MSNSNWTTDTENALMSMKGKKPARAQNVLQFRHQPSQLNNNYFFLTEVLSTAWLPRRLASKDQTKFTRKYGNISLTVNSGTYPDGKPIGLPSGSYARKLFISLIDKAYRSQSTTVEFDSIHGILKESGLSGTGKGQRIFREQGLRLATCNIEVWYKEPDGNYLRYQGSIFDMMEIHQIFDKGQMSLIPNRVVFTERFFKHCIQRSGFGYLKEVMKSCTNPLAIDLILWITRRMAFIDHDVFISIDNLKDQFANSDKVKNFDFTRNLTRALEEVSEVSGISATLNPLHYGERGLLLHQFTKEQKKLMFRYNPRLVELK